MLELPVHVATKTINRLVSNPRFRYVASRVLILWGGSVMVFSREVDDRLLAWTGHPSPSAFLPAAAVALLGATLWVIDYLEGSLDALRDKIPVTEQAESPTDSANSDDATDDAPELTDARDLLARQMNRAIIGAKNRLRSEIRDLKRRSSYNLGIGFFTTFAAAGLLAYLMAGDKTPLPDLAAVLARYVPRVSFAIFVELFSFFFLRMYRETLAEIRAYQSDLTTLTLRQIGVMSALRVDSPEADTSLSERLLALKDSSHGPAKDKNADLDPKAVLELAQGFIKVFSGKRAAKEE
jgi:hypothetical protein